MRLLPEDSEINILEVQVVDSTSFLSSLTLAILTSTSAGEIKVIHQLHGANGSLHCLVKYDVTKVPSSQ